MIAKRVLIVCITLVASSLSLTALSAQDDAAIRTLDAYASKAVNAWQVPGLVMTVVKDGEVVLTKAYGVRSLDSGEKVDTETRFLCASTTKAFTAVAMAMLVDDGKVRWDDPVVQHMPEFQLYDPYVTRNLTVRDLFIHRAGLGNADFLWSVFDIPESEILHRMRYLKPAYPFRSGYTYQNIMYLAAGELIERISGKPWEDFIEERIFQPLGMDATVAFKKQVETLPNVASAHYKIGGKIQEIPQTNADRIGPAGSMWSTITDMSKWIKFLLDDGVVNGKRLLKPATVDELFTPQTLIPQHQFYPTVRITKPHWTSYGLAWFQHDYKGKKVDFHTGSLAGMVAIAGLIREEGIGVYIMGNLDHAEVRHALMYKTFDLFLGGGNTDWSQEFLALYADLHKAENDRQDELKKMRVFATKPSLELNGYVGTYSDPLYGRITVSKLSDGLQIKFSDENFLTLKHWHYDTFMGTWSKAWWPPSFVTFTLNDKGEVDQLSLDDMVYKKR